MDHDCDNAKVSSSPRPLTSEMMAACWPTTSARPSGPRRRSDLSPHPDRLQVAKRPGSLCRELAAVAEVFAPEGELGVRGHHPLTNTAPASRSLRTGGARRRHWSRRWRRAEVGGIGQLDGLVDVLDAEQGGQRPEALFAVKAYVGCQPVINVEG